MNYQPVQHYTPSLWNNKIVFNTWKNWYASTFLFTPTGDLRSLIAGVQISLSILILFAVNVISGFFWPYSYKPISGAQSTYPALCFLFNSSRGWLSIYTDEPWKGLKFTCLIDLEFRFIGFSHDAKEFHNCATWISNLVYNTRFSSSKAKSIESLLTDILDLIDRATPYESGEQMGINWSKDWSKRWLVITYLGKRPGAWL